MNQKQKGFSLIEVTLALGVIGFALIAILGLVPVALKTSKEATNDTRMSLIAMDVYSRTRASIPLGDDTTKPNNPAAFATYKNNQGKDNALTKYYYYDREGLYLDQDGIDGDGNANYLANYYRAQVDLGRLGSYPPGTDKDYLLGVTIRLGAPAKLEKNGALASISTAVEVYTFYLTRP
jgi:uncharacterized protein (TIGR02598 family)